MNDWEIIALNDKRISTEIRSGYACGEKNIEGGAAHLRMNNISVNGSIDFSLVRRIPKSIANQKKLWIQQGDILFCNTNSTALVGKTCLFSGWEEKCTFSNHLTKIRCNKKYVVPAWVALYVQHLWSIGYFAVNCKEFIGQSSFSNDKLKGVDVPVPPLDEQRRIVARIEELTRRAENARRQRQGAVALFLHGLVAMVKREFDLLADHRFGLLGDLAAIIGGNSIPEDAPSPEGNSDRVGLMKVADMNSSGNEKIIEGCKLETTFEEAKRRKLRILPAGSIVFPKRGGAIATNKKRILGLPAALDPNLMGVYPICPETLKPAYLRWWFESIDLTSIQEDGGIPQVNKKHLISLEVPLLSPPEQEEIVSRLRAMQDKAEEITRLQNAVDKELAQFRPALLAKAFRGEL